MKAIIATVSGLLLATSALPAQQPLTLGQALARAEHAAFGNRMANSQAAAEATRELAALRGILPSLRVEAGYARTTDPTGAFGITLRQRSVTQVNFDPDRLNHPRPIDNYAGAVVVEAPLLNTDAHLGRRAAANAADAALANAAWTQTNIRVDVIRAYFGAVLAAEKVVTMEAALNAARGHVRQTELMAKTGLVTRSDALMASVKAGEIETAWLEVRGEASLARRALAVLLGEPGTAYQLPQLLPDVEQVRAILQPSTPTIDVSRRSDVIAAQKGRSAARLDRSRAGSLYLPRLNGVARYDWSSASKLYGGDNYWTVGMMATWTPFTGAAEIADRRAADARAKMAAAALEAAEAQAAVEIDKATVEHDVALNRLEIAERTLRQGTEAHRIITRKYEGGLASVVELLDGAAIETGARLNLSHALYQGIIAAAQELKATGGNPADIAVRLTQIIGVDE